jgi:hypothetical protein
MIREWQQLAAQRPWDDERNPTLTGQSTFSQAAIGRQPLDQSLVNIPAPADFLNDGGIIQLALAMIEASFN